MRTLLAMLFFCALSVSSLHAQTVDEVIAKNIEARGGMENWQAVKSMTISGDYTAFSLTHPFTIYRKRPQMYRFEHTLSSQNVVLVYDGKQAWQIHPFYGNPNPMKIPNADSLVVERETPIESVFFNYKAKGHKAELLGKEDVDGIDCYKIKMTLKNGQEETWFIDAETHLEVLQKASSYDFGRPAILEAFFDDYREVAGVKVPHLIEIEYDTRHRVYEITDVVVNTEVADSLFTMPVVAASEEN